ncbi:hypothetical protein BCR34DRAFT_597286 [Clohesyomyces aquaticus]|uniref:Uncharacterized protein n=1 Tax=Clohesyomyces aquaticus TaxID=1231657 RepID=A0A1Y2A2Y9_9PLEO|nr:hypothetical protein BCR34DRAFT_597286 [Clohesyomyces aquaticus]
MEKDQISAQTLACNAELQAQKDKDMLEQMMQFHNARLERLKSEIEPSIMRLYEQQEKLRMALLEWQEKEVKSNADNTRFVAVNKRPAVTLTALRKLGVGEHVEDFDDVQRELELQARLFKDWGWS